MYWIKILNWCCYALTVAAIVFGAAGSIIGVWNDANDVVWRSVVTAMILAAAGIAVIVVNQVLGVRVAMHETLRPLTKPGPEAAGHGPELDQGG